MGSAWQQSSIWNRFIRSFMDLWEGHAQIGLVGKTIMELSRNHTFVILPYERYIQPDSDALSAQASILLKML